MPPVTVARYLSGARPDVRPTNFPTRILTREEWDDLRRPSGPYQAAYQPKRPVPDVDFEAEDGSLHKTAEACLAYELKKRFGVETLAEVEDLIVNTAFSKPASPQDTETKDSAAEPSAPTYGRGPAACWPPPLASVASSLPKLPGQPV